MCMRARTLWCDRVNSIQSNSTKINNERANAQKRAAAEAAAATKRTHRTSVRIMTFQNVNGNIHFHFIEVPNEECYTHTKHSIQYNLHGIYKILLRK